jgi:hypothetical protein
MPLCVFVLFVWHVVMPPCPGRPQGKEPWNKGKQLSAATRAKMSASKTGRRLSRGTRHAMSQAHTGLTHSPVRCAASCVEAQHCPYVVQCLHHSTLAGHFIGRLVTSVRVLSTR